MATKSIIMKYGLSPSPDVVQYRLRIVPTGTENVSALNSYFVLDGSGSADLGSMPELQNLDGVYDFYLSAVDDAGNESDYSVFTGKAIDFLAPEPPGEITFEVAG